MAKTFFHWLQPLLKVKVQLAMLFICCHPSTIMTVVIILNYDLRQCLSLFAFLRIILSEIVQIHVSLCQVFSENS